MKLPVYRQIPSVQEILLIASDGVYAELHRRCGAQWITEIVRGAAATLIAIGPTGRVWKRQYRSADSDVAYCQGIERPIRR